MNRKLDGEFFRVERNGKYENVCFSDLTGTEMDKILDEHSKEWIKSLCKGLAFTLKRLGDKLDIERVWR